LGGWLELKPLGFVGNQGGTKQSPNNRSPKCKILFLGFSFLSDALKFVLKKKKQIHNTWD
jgi:hypothetical protein